MTSFSFIVILALAFAFGYLNGLNSAGSVITTVISSRALAPRPALALSILCMCAGPFIFGLAVAGTIATDLIALPAITMPVIVAALLGAIIWVALSAWLRLPCSTTHAFLGSLIGAAWAGFGIQAVIAHGIVKALIALLLSPLLGIAVGYAVVKLCYWVSGTASPHINNWFKAGQVMCSLLVGVSLGSNDSQKITGIVALGIVAADKTSFAIPAWAIFFSLAAMAAGTLIGSQRIARTLGNRLYKIEPIHGFGAQTASGIILLGAALLGGPVSGSQVMASAIVGAGSAQHMRKVRWGVFRRILNTWVLTLPASAIMGAGLYLLCARFSL